MKTFDIATDRVILEEGGAKFIDNPNDPGGATKFGISIRFAGSIRLDIDGDGDTDATDIKALTREQALGLYRDYFWLPLRCDALPPAIAYIVYDCGVNMGKSIGAKLLQRCLRMTDDGVIGPLTLNALPEKPDGRRELVALYTARRMKRYAELLADNAVQRALKQTNRDFSTFIGGWCNRAARVQLVA